MTRVVAFLFVLAGSVVERSDGVSCYNCEYYSNIPEESTCTEPFNAADTPTCNGNSCMFTYLNVSRVELSYDAVVRSCFNVSMNLVGFCPSFELFGFSTFVSDSSCCYRLAATTQQGTTDSTICFCGKDNCNGDLPHEAPGTGDQPSATTKKTPYSGTRRKTLKSGDKPSNTTDKTLNSGDKPSNTTRKTLNSGDKPSNTRHKALNSGDKPSNTRHKALNSGDKPSNTRRKTLNSGDKPSNTRHRAHNSGDKPSNTRHKTLNFGDKPSNTTDKTLNSGDKPSNTTDKTLNSGDKPSNTTDKTLNSGDKPSNTRH